MEENPQQPPEAAWQNISESLELETAWNGIEQDLELDNLWTTIDGRLQLHEQLLWWDRAGAVLTTVLAAVAVFIPLLLQPQLSERLPLAAQQQQETSAVAEAPQNNSGNSISNTPVQPEKGIRSVESSSTGATASEASGTGEAAGKAIPAAENAMNGSSDAAQASATAARVTEQSAGINPSAQASTVTSSSKRGVSTSSATKALTENTSAGKNSDAVTALNHNAVTSAGGVKGLSVAGENLLHHPVSGISAHLLLQEGKVDANITATQAEEAETVVPVADKKNGAGGWRVGAGLSGRMTWLMNEKTLTAMEKSSLTTSLPAYRKSFFLQAEKGLTPKLALITDLVVYSEAGQRYEEYQGGIYGKTDTELRYSNLNILAAYNPRGRAMLIRPHTRWLAGVSGGWLHSASLSGPSGKSDISQEYKKTAAAVILGYEYNFPLSKRLWVNYGLKGQLDLLNVYGGSPDIPAEFRQTHSTFLDFIIGFKYEL